jgi:hypothetical protein
MKMQTDLERLWKEARSFPGSRPPEPVEEIDWKVVNGDTFILYKGSTGYFYNSVSGMQFAREMEILQRERRYKKRRRT